MGPNFKPQTKMPFDSPDNILQVLCGMESQNYPGFIKIRIKKKLTMKISYILISHEPG